MLSDVLLPLLISSYFNLLNFGKMSTGSGSQREETSSSLPILADYSDYNVSDLRALVISAVKSGKCK